MNKQLRILISVLLMGMFVLVSPSDSAGQGIVIVNSAPIKPYQEAIDAFNKRVGTTQGRAGINSIQPYQICHSNISKDETPQKFSEKLTNMHPELIIAVGSTALTLSLNFPGPIVYLMVSRPQLIIGTRQNISGVQMLVAAPILLDAIKSNLPLVRTLGEIYNPNGNGPFLVTLGKQTKALQILAEPITSPKAMKLALDRLTGKIDALWIPPDSTIISPTTLEILTLYSMSNRVPLITFAPKYLQHGAAMAIYSTPKDMGEQAAHLALRLLNSTSPGKSFQEYSETARTMTNKQVFKNLGLTNQSANLK